MNETGPHLESTPTDPRQAIGAAIQNLMAARLGRGFIPLGVLVVTAILGGVLGMPGSLWLGLGALATGAAMLAYGLRIVQRALRRPHRLWMSLAMVGSLIPPFYALYVFGWRGLRGIAQGGGLGPITFAIFSFLVGVWVLRSWMKVVEIERLAQIMSMNLDGEGGPA